MEGWALPPSTGRRVGCRGGGAVATRCSGALGAGRVPVQLPPTPPLLASLWSTLAAHMGGGAPVSPQAYILAGGRGRSLLFYLPLPITGRAV